MIDTLQFGSVQLLLDSPAPRPLEGKTDSFLETISWLGRGHKGGLCLSFSLFQG